MTISVILLDTRTCIILFYFRYSHLTSDDNVPVLQFIVDIFEILKYSNNRQRIFILFYFFYFFFQCEMKFYFTEFDTKIQILVFMSEIKFDLTLKKKKFKISVSFMLLFAIIKLLPTLRLSRQKTKLFFFFFCHFASI